jgi:hypothetical protein
MSRSVRVQPVGAACTLGAEATALRQALVKGDTS